MVRTVHHMAHYIRCVGIYNVLSACVCRYVGIHIVHETFNSGLMNLDIYCRLTGAVMHVHYTVNCTVQQRHGSLFNCEKGESARCLSLHPVAHQL